MNRRIITIFLILLGMSLIPVYWLRLAFTIVPIRDGLYLLAVFTAVFAGCFALMKYGFKHARRVTLLSLTIGVTCSLISELIFEYHYIIDKHNIPFPSIGDFFALSYYVLFFIGLTNEIRLAHINWKHMNKRILIMPILTSLVLVGLVSYLGVYKAYDPTVDVFTNIISMAYGVADLILIILSLFLLVLVKEYQGGRFSKIWLILLAGFVCSLTADIFWSFFPTQYHDEVWFYKSFFDSFAMLAYLCIAQALFSFGFSIVDAYKMAGITTNKDVKPLTLKEVTPKTV